MSVTVSPSWSSRMGRGVPFLMAFGLASLGIGLARGVTTTYVPVLLDDSGASPGAIGVLMMVNPVAGFTMPLVVGYLGDRWSRQRPWGGFLAAGAAVASTGLISVGILATGSVALIAVSALGVYVGVATAAMAHRSWSSCASPTRSGRRRRALRRDRRRRADFSASWPVAR